METSMYERVLVQLEHYKGRWSEVAAGSGVSKRTIEKIARREIKDPGVSHVEALDRWFAGQNSTSAGDTERVAA
jgi:lipocalin